MINQPKSSEEQETGSKKSGYETPKFSQETSGGSKRAPTATATFLLELQHSQITEVGSEYEVTQNDTKPTKGSACTSQQTFSFAQSAKGDEYQEDYNGEDEEYGEYYQEDESAHPQQMHPPPTHQQPQYQQEGEYDDGYYQEEEPPTPPPVTAQLKTEH